MSDGQPPEDPDARSPAEESREPRAFRADRDIYAAGRDLHMHPATEWPVNQPDIPGSELWLNDVRHKVRDHWVHDVLQRPREYTLRVEPNLAEQPGAVFDPLKPGRPPTWGDDHEPLPRETRLAELFAGRARRHLLVLGKPGAGKSTALLRLAENLLDQADADPRKPVPVVLQLSAWDGPKDTLGWVARQVSLRYEVPEDQVRQWLTVGRLVLLLDGLDEITDVARQRDCVESLSALRKDKPAGMVVCCRTEDYRRIGKRLEFGLAVTVRALTPEQMDRNLDVGGRALAPLRLAVRTDPELAKLLDTPLMLGVAVLAYPGHIPVEDILTGNQDERLERLWSRYVTEMLTRRRDPSDEFSLTCGHLSRRAEYRHLVWLARLMKHQGRTEIYPDWFGSRWLSTRGDPGTHLDWQRVSTLCTSLAFALVIGVPLGVVYGFTSSPGGTAASRVIDGLVYGITGGLVGGTCYGLTDRLAPAKNLSDLWHRFRPVARYALGGLSCGLAYGLTWKAAAGLFGQPRLLVTEGLLQAFVSGLTDGVFCGLAARLIGGISAAENARVKWRWSWRDARYGLLGGLCCGICYGLVYGAGSGQMTGPPGAVVAGLVSALGFGVICGWQPDSQKEPTKPGQALRQTLRTYGTRIIASLAGAVIISAALTAIPQTLLPAAHENLARAIPAIVATGLSALVVAVVGKGLAPIIDHHVARSIATWNGFLPRDLVNFLNHCEERILLHRSGGHYSFLHRSLCDHLAACDPLNPPPFVRR